VGRARVSLVDSWFDRFPAGLVFLSEFLQRNPAQLVPRADRDGSEKLPGRERSATFHTPYRFILRIMM
jgi:hypothetical protein